MTREPTGGLSRIIFKLRREGPAWITKRVSAEVAYPTTGPGRVIHAIARRGISVAAALPRLIRTTGTSKLPGADTTLFAFYDLGVAPITFDFLWFLVAADLDRRRRGLDNIHVVIVPGQHLRLRQERGDYDAAVPPSARGERIHTILIEGCRLLSSCVGVTQAASRPEAAFFRSVASHIFPGDYEPALPTFPTSRVCLDAARRGEGPIAVLRATAERKDNVERWLVARGIGSRQLVTITLRGYGYMPQRNSDISAWIAFAGGLDRTKFFLVFIPDTEETIEGVPVLIREFPVLSEAAWSVGLRMALYERAYINMGVNTGPMGLCWLNELTRYVTLKMAPSGVPQTTPDFFRSLGFEPGQPLPFATPCQELVWQDDTLATIQSAFARVVTRIEGHGAG